LNSIKAKRMWSRVRIQTRIWMSLLRDIDATLVEDYVARAESAECEHTERRRKWTEHLSWRNRRTVSRASAVNVLPHRLDTLMIRLL
jgi:hypothetical protein